MTTVHLQLPANQPAEVRQDLAPPTVADKGCHARRVDDIDKQHGRHLATVSAADHQRSVGRSLARRQDARVGKSTVDGSAIGLPIRGRRRIVLKPLYRRLTVGSIAWVRSKA